VTLKDGLGSLKVIGTDTDRSAAYDFLLTFHSNHVPISYTVTEINGDFSRKSQFFPPRVFSAPAEGKKKLDDGATRPIKKFGYSRLDSIYQRDGRTDRQTDTGRQQRPYLGLRIASRGRY